MQKRASVMRAFYLLCISIIFGVKSKQNPTMPGGIMREIVIVFDSQLDTSGECEIRLSNLVVDLAALRIGDSWDRILVFPTLESHVACAHILERLFIPTKCRVSIEPVVQKGILPVFQDRKDFFEETFLFVVNNLSDCVFQTFINDWNSHSEMFGRSRIDLPEIEESQNKERPSALVISVQGSKRWIGEQHAAMF